MKHGIMWTSVLLLGMMQVACDDHEVEVSSDGNLQVVAEALCTDSRTGFKPDGTFFWNEGDELAVELISRGNAYVQDVASFSMNAGANGSNKGAGFEKATFSGIFNAGFKLGNVAVSPYGASDVARNAVRFQGDNLLFTYPALYNYVSVDKRLPSNSDEPAVLKGFKNFNPVMAGLITSDGSVELKHLGGFIWLKIEKMPMANGVFVFQTNKKIAGEYVIAKSRLADTPQFEVVDTTDPNEQQVRIKFQGATVDGPGYFYLPVPTGTYDQGFSIAFKNTADGPVVSSNTYKNVVRVGRKEVRIFTLSSLNAN